MSLQVWLPLNGNLTQQGLSDIQVTNNGATIDNNGKIGKCYYFDGNAHYLQFNKTLGDIYSNDFSWAVWLKPTDDTRGIIISEYASSGSSNVAFELLTNRQIRIYWNGSPDLSTGITIPKDTWSHVAITKQDNLMIVYINGEKKWTNSTSFSKQTSTSYIRLGDDYRGGTSVSYMGYMNDVRIYDHALSAKEVKELSKGLVLHYKLDGKYETTTNLASSSVGGWNNSGNCTRLTNDTSLNSSKPTQSNVASVKITTTGNCALTCGTTSVNLPSKTLTFSIWCYLSGPQENNTIYIRSTKTDGNVGNFEYKGSTNPATWPLNQWLYLTKTITTASDATTFYFCTYANTLDRYIALNGWQIEEKDHASPYIEPGGSRNYTTEFDCSGYNNNGIRNNNPQFVQNTIRYKNSISLDGTNQTIEIGNLSTIVPSGIFTFNIWFYKTELSGKGYDTIFGGPSGFEVETRNAAETNPVVVPWNWGKSSITYEFNKWNMLTMIKTSSETQWYLNGELWATGSVGSIPSGNYFLGSWRDTNSQNYKGLLSDARIYATALSAEDVLELYHTSASIDNKGNVYAYELEEV